MEGIPEPVSRGRGPAKAGKPNLILGIVAGVLFVAAAGLWFYQTRGAPETLPPAAQTADDKLRAELEAKNPPPPEPDVPVEPGEGRKLQR